MSPELDKKLCEKYPEIFRDRNAPMTQTCMCWGFDVEDGWYPLIDNLCRLIMWHCRNYKWNTETKKYDELEPPVATQVKEKMGTLRFYTSGGDDAIYNYISFAESMSGKICEECGMTVGARTWGFGWLKTLCIPHAIEYYGKEEIDQYLAEEGKR